MRSRSLLVLLVSATVPATLVDAARASMVVVPDQHATIQAAIDSSTADSILVRPGTYDSLLTVHRIITLAPYRTELWPSRSAPRVGRVEITVGGYAGQAVLIRGFHLTRGVRRQDCTGGLSGWLWVDGCRIDSGFTGTTCGSIKFTNCIIRGGIDNCAWHSEVSNCTIIGGGIRIHCSESGSSIFGNYIVGPNPAAANQAGISVVNVNSTGSVYDNIVSGFVDGIVVYGRGADIVRNDVSDCSRVGIVGTGTPTGSLSSEWQAPIADNRVVRCGSHGMDLEHFGGEVVRNTIDSVGGAGIRVRGTSYVIGFVGNRISHTGSQGIVQEFEHRRVEVFRIEDNVILNAGGDGIAMDVPTFSILRNVVGHPAGRGIVLSRLHQMARIKNNTVYLSGGAGFELSGAPPDTIRNNIAHRSEGCGLRWIDTGTGAPSPACNDWYENVGGPTCGVATGATDLQVDPLFCGPNPGDVYLAASSPLLDAPACGLIGARGQGCTTTLDVPVGSGAAGVSLSVGPSPGTSSRLRFSWAGATGEVRLELFDVLGSRRWKSAAPSTQRSLEWDGRDSRGREVAPGVYFAKLTCAAGTARARVVIR